MTSSCICQEQCIDSAALQEFRQLYPVPESSLGRRLVLGILWSCQHSGPSPSIPIPTFHCPGDRCPTVDISKALSKICFLPLPTAEPFWLAVALSPMIRSFQGEICFLSFLRAVLARASSKRIGRWSIRVRRPLMFQTNKARKDGSVQGYYPHHPNTEFAHRRRISRHRQCKRGERQASEP